MSIVDMLSQQEGQVASFTVDTAQEKVPLVNADNGELRNPQFINFASYDNLTLLSVTYVLPLSFEMYNAAQAVNGQEFRPYLIDINWVDVQSDNVIVPDELPYLYIPFANYEMSVNKFMKVPTDTIASAGFRLAMTFRDDNDYQNYVSMYNVDEAFQGFNFKVPIYAKVEHTLPMFNG